MGRNAHRARTAPAGLESAYDDGQDRPADPKQAPAADSASPVGHGGAITWFIVAAALDGILGALAAMGEGGALLVVVACFAVVPLLVGFVWWAALLVAGLVGSFRSTARGGWWYRAVLAHVVIAVGLLQLIASHGEHIVI